MSGSESSEWSDVYVPSESIGVMNSSAGEWIPGGLALLGHTASDTGVSFTVMLVTACLGRRGVKTERG